MQYPCPPKITGNRDDEYDLEKIKMGELISVVKKAKRRKAAGPDEVPMEIIKEMDDDNKELILELLNQWWENEEIPKEQLQARIALIFKKGSTDKFEKYIPISLLNTLYKIYAAIIRMMITRN